MKQALLNTIQMVQNRLGSCSKAAYRRIRYFRFFNPLQMVEQRALAEMEIVLVQLP